MGFLLEVFFFCMALLAVILAVSWLYEKYWPKRPVQPVPCIVYPVNPLYREYRLNYEQFGELVYSCIESIHETCGLEYKEKVNQIYCRQIDDRIYIDSNGLITFRYEIPRQLRGGISNIGKSSTNHSQHNLLIKQTFSMNFPSYLDDEYFFRGDIEVSNAANNRVYIEIHGVDKEVEYGGEILW